MAVPAPIADDDGLELAGLTKSFGGVNAVDDLTLRLGRDEMRCIIGPNGCGKTTLFNLITGYLPPSAGSVRFGGRNLAGLPLHAIARAGIVRKFQVPSVFAGLSVEANIQASLAAGQGGSSAADLLGLVRLGARRSERAGVLSHGEKQWLELAMVLATDPRLILLDEPVAGMTRQEKTETARLIAEIRRDRAVSVLVIEHDMGFVEALDCEVAVMMLGRIIASGRFAVIRQDPRVREAYLETANV
jgi:urea transport system ATP-binding protein